MADLSAHARRVLALARDADAPTSEVQERVERALSARIDALPDVTPLGSSSAPLAAKALIPVGIALTIAGAGWFGVRSRAPSETAPAQLSSAATPPATIVPQVSAPSAPLEAPSSDDTSSPSPMARAPTPGARERTTPKPAVRDSASQPVPLPSPAPVDERAESASQGSPSPSATFEIAREFLPATAPTSQPAPDPLLAETEALRQAQRALRSGDAARALELLSSQDRTFATGSLQQERAAARVLALCQSGRPEQARALAARFIERWPRSALRARVTAACRAPE